MKWIMWCGALLALLGILGLAIPVFTTSQTKEVANWAMSRFRAPRIQSTERSIHVVPQALSAGVLVLGLVLIRAGAYARRAA
jgi:hypothetical protein